MKCRECNGIGKIEVENGAPDDFVTKNCIDCGGTGEQIVTIHICLRDYNDDCIVHEDVPTVSYEQGAEAVARLIKYAQEN
jgi:DnaJ-class molecular chaperone